MIAIGRNRADGNLALRGAMWQFGQSGALGANGEIRQCGYDLSKAKVKAFVDKVLEETIRLSSTRCSAQQVSPIGQSGCQVD